MDTKQIRNTLLLVLTAIIWGCAFVAQSVGAEYVGPFTFIAARSWLGGAAVLPVVLFLRSKSDKSNAASAPAPQRKTLIWGGIACGFCLFIAMAAQQIGVAYTTAAKAGFITTMYVIIVPILTLFMGRKVGKKIWLCVLLGVVGLYLLCMVGGLSLSMGDAAVLASALLFSFHILTVDHFAPKVNSIQLSCIQFLAAAAFSTVCMILFETPTWESISAAAMPILYAGIMSTGVGFTLQLIAQKDLNPTIASLAMSMESVFSALAGWIFLGQGLSPRELGGCALMFAAIILAQLPDQLFSKRGNRKIVLSQETQDEPTI